MEHLIKIEGSYRTMLPNVLHVQFHDRMNALITGEDTEKLHLSEELLKEWRKYIDMEISINREASAVIETKDLLAKDAERDSVITYLFSTVRSEMLSIDPDVSRLAHLIYYAIAPYVGIQREAFEAESMHIKGMIEDLMKVELKAAVEALRLQPVIDKLKTLNDEYESIRSGRTDSRAENKAPASKDIRPNTDAAYELVCEYIHASYVLGDADARNTIGSIINRMNQLIGEIKTAYRQSIAQKNRKGKEENSSDSTEQS